MTHVTLHLPPELSDKLKRAASEQAKEPEAFALEVLEQVLAAPSLDFIGAWADSDITPETILEARTPGRGVILNP